jgi:hypothetical protein
MPQTVTEVMMTANNAAVTLTNAIIHLRTQPAPDHVAMRDAVTMLEERWEFITDAWLYMHTCSGVEND